jgi:hypothetical protein
VTVFFSLVANSIFECTAKYEIIQRKKKSVFFFSSLGLGTMGKVKRGDLVPCWFSVRINKRAGLARIKPTDGWMADNKDTTLKDAKLRKKLNGRADDLKI